MQPPSLSPASSIVSRRLPIISTLRGIFHRLYAFSLETHGGAERAFGRIFFVSADIDPDHVAAALGNIERVGGPQALGPGLHEVIADKLAVYFGVLGYADFQCSNLLAAGTGNRVSGYGDVFQVLSVGVHTGLHRFVFVEEHARLKPAAGFALLGGADRLDQVHPVAGKRNQRFIRPVLRNNGRLGKFPVRWVDIGALLDSGNPLAGFAVVALLLVRKWLHQAERAGRERPSLGNELKTQFVFGKMGENKIGGRGHAGFFPLPVIKAAETVKFAVVLATAQPAVYLGAYRLREIIEVLDLKYNALAARRTVAVEPGLRGQRAGGAGRKDVLPVACAPVVSHVNWSGKVQAGRCAVVLMGNPAGGR